ncbi:DUF418 domain-containing protein [Robertmurraya sp. Marseille-Q9965]
MYIPEKDRIVSLDMMRGFAILGIFLVNMLSFHSPLLYLDPFSWWDSDLDKGTYIFIDVFAQGSFYPLFSLLFGYGLVLIYERTIKREQAFLPIAARRLLVLLFIGMIHAFFIWHGDILITYAIFGLLFLLFRKLSGTAMIIMGGLFWLIPNILLTLLFVIALLLSPAGDLSMYEPELARQSVEIYQQGSYFSIFQQRFEDWYAVNNLANGIFMLFSIFPFFLIGGGAAKLKWMEKVKELKKPFFISLLIFFTVGLFLKLSPYIFDRNIVNEYIQDSFGGPMLAFSFALAIALWAEKSNRFLRILAPVGKMSMSNYLLQSVVSTILFYSYGFGLYDQISAFWGTVLVVFIYFFQIIWSSYWLKNHHYGPVEWLWRSITYLKWPVWKKNN